MNFIESLIRRVQAITNGEGNNIKYLPEKYSIGKINVREKKPRCFKKDAVSATNVVFFKNLLILTVMAA
jgi:hypothetical protein